MVADAFQMLQPLRGVKVAGSPIYLLLGSTDNLLGLQTHDILDLAGDKGETQIRPHLPEPVGAAIREIFEPGLAELEQTLASFQFPGPFVNQFLQTLLIDSIFALQSRLFQRPVDRVPHQIDFFYRLAQIVVGAPPHCLNRFVDPPHTGDHNDGSVRGQNLTVHDEFQAVHFRHAQVGQHKIGWIPFDGVQSIPSVLRIQYPEAHIFQLVTEALPDNILVLNDQDGFYSRVLIHFPHPSQARLCPKPGELPFPVLPGRTRAF